VGGGEGGDSMDLLFSGLGGVFSECGVFYTVFFLFKMSNSISPAKSEIL